MLTGLAPSEEFRTLACWAMLKVLLAELAALTADPARRASDRKDMATQSTVCLLDKLAHQAG
jgi:hypothetical protein